MPIGVSHSYLMNTKTPVWSFRDEDDLTLKAQIPNGLSIHQ